MSTKNEPLVQVVLPVYNGAEFMERCAESILAQTYGNFEFLIVNNRSTDRTFEIAQAYARKDSRVHLHDNQAFLSVIENHNHALSLLSSSAKYCKVIAADDWIFPECLTRMVALAEANPSIGLVGCYLLAGKTVMNAGLPYETSVVSGREISRSTLLGETHVFGSPTSLLYRADLVRGRTPFFPHTGPHADTSACYLSLQHSDFGFVHQVLAYAEIHAKSQTSRSIKYGTNRRSVIADVARLGPLYLAPEEVQARIDHLMGYYYLWLVGALIANRGDDEFWPKQKRELEDVGIHLEYSKLAAAAVKKGVRMVLDPEWAIAKLSAFKRSDPKKIQAQYY